MTFPRTRVAPTFISTASICDAPTSIDGENSISAAGGSLGSCDTHPEVGLIRRYDEVRFRFALVSWANRAVAFAKLYRSALHLAGATA